MLRSKSILAVTGLLLAAACSDAVAPSSSDLPASLALGTGGRAVANVKMMDACDPESFAGVPGGCQRNGGVTMEQFLSQLGELGRAPGWKFSPTDLFLHEGDEYMATNVGGEVHTFTEVEDFGGGIVPAFNNLLGLTIAPECQALTSADFIPPGQSTDADETEEVGDEHYQCCIHPWMRMTVHVAER